MNERDPEPIPERREAWREEARGLHSRLDRHDKKLDRLAEKIDEILSSQQASRTALDAHIADESRIRPALEKLVVLWEGSRLVLPFLAAVVIGAWGMVVWIRDHVRM